jgi:hypothetical protein
LNEYLKVMRLPRTLTLSGVSRRIAACTCARRGKPPGRRSRRSTGPGPRIRCATSVRRSCSSIISSCGSGSCAAGTALRRLVQRRGHRHQRLVVQRSSSAAFVGLGREGQREETELTISEHFCSITAAGLISRSMPYSHSSPIGLQICDSFTFLW